MLCIKFKVNLTIFLCTFIFLFVACPSYGIQHNFEAYDNVFLSNENLANIDGPPTNTKINTLDNINNNHLPQSICHIKSTHLENKDKSLKSIIYKSKNLDYLDNVYIPFCMDSVLYFEKDTSKEHYVQEKAYSKVHLTNSDINKQRDLNFDIKTDFASNAALVSKFKIDASKQKIKRRNVIENINIDYNLYINKRNSISVKDFINGRIIKDSSSLSLTDVNLNFSHFNKDLIKPKSQEKAPYSNFYSIKTDSLKLSGDVNINIITQLLNKDYTKRGNSIEVLENVDLKDLKSLNIKVLDDKNLNKNIIGKIDLKGEHIVLDLSKVKNKESKNLQGKLKSPVFWTEDYGAVKLLMKANLKQDKSTGNVILEKITLKNGGDIFKQKQMFSKKKVLPSNIVVTVLDNAFSINRMSFLTADMIDNRLASLLHESYSDKKAGFWHQCYNNKIDFKTHINYDLPLQTDIMSHKVGFDKSFKKDSAMHIFGTSAGFSFMHAKNEKEFSSSNLKQTILSFYTGAYKQNNMYYKAHGNVSLFSSTIKAIPSLHHEILQAKSQMRAYSLALTFGRKFTLFENVFFDTNLKFDYSYFVAKDIKTNNNLYFKQDSYSNAYIKTQAQLSRDFKQLNTYLYSKLSSAFTLTDTKSYMLVKDGQNNTDYYFKKPNYNLYYYDLAFGSRHNFKQNLVFDFEFNRMFISGAKDKNMGLKGEIRYFF